VESGTHERLTLFVTGLQFPESSRQCLVADLMGLDRATFWSDAVSEPLTGEHFGRQEL
jgi:hypothetical protein